MLKIEDVEQFHRAFGHPVKDESQYASHFDPSDIDVKDYSPEIALRKLRTDLIYEESSELLEACESEDRVLYADALYDLLYVVYGTILALGAPRAIGKIVHECNMSKGLTCSSCDGKGTYEVPLSTDPVTMTVACAACNGTGIIPILRADGKILKSSDWVDDKPLIAAEIERVCRDWDKEHDHAR